MPSQATDDRFLLQALRLAQTGVALTSPNPCVGAVLVANNAVVGEGSHTYEGKKHAEILALEQAADRARGATLFLNLEPCSHQGRTGPCADAVIAAGLQRVVCCMEDPNPLVAGQGFAKLRAAGIEVEVGKFAEEARKLNEAFAMYVRHQRPLVTLKSAMTLDGKIALHADPTASSTGATRTDWITGEAARAHVQQLRHQSDVILTGIGTVLADDPLLSDRTELPRRRRLLRVILDSHLRLPVDSRLVQSAQEDVLVLSASTNAAKKQALENRGIRVEQVQPSLLQSQTDRLDLAKVLQRLGELEITSVLTEGGSHLNTAVLNNGLVDKVWMHFASKIFGESAVPFTAPLDCPLTLSATRFHQFGKDFAIEAYLRDPYSD